MGHNDYQWRQLALKFKAHCRTRNTLCHLCLARGDIDNATIDYTAKRLTPNSFEADHIKPWTKHPQLRYQWSNLAASHSRCNRQRRHDELQPAITHDQWIKPDW